MKKFFLMTLIFLSLNVYSSTEIWKLGDHFFSFTKDETTQSLISDNCIKPTCQALKALKASSLRKLSADLFIGGKNPGAVICKNKSSGIVVYLKDLNGNDNSFCKFKDLSMVSNSSLEYQARINDK